MEGIVAKKRNTLLKYGISSVHLGSEFTGEEVEFIRAMETYKRVYKRPFPTCHEVLGVLKSLGYRKVDKPDPAMVQAMESV